jgi:PAS domain S-box-containing protein
VLGLFGYSREEFLVLTFDQLLADPFMFTHLKLKFVQQQNQLSEERILMIRKDGTNFWAHFSAKLVKEKESEWIAGFVEDITAAITMENQLKDLENDHQRTQYELDRFIYSASHDIRSPVCSILGLINIMKLDYTDSKSRKFIELLEVSAQRLDRFVVDLGSFAENSRKDIKSKQINFKEVLSEILERLKDHASFSRVTINHEINCDAIFYSDYFRMRLILNQIIKNSLDFCDLGKRTPKITVQISASQDKAIIEILDNGIGIAKTHLEKVFDLFYRATSISKGSGIGLYVTREAVIKLGGVISIHSEYGIGTSLKIELPNSHKGVVATRKWKLKKAKVA